SPDGRTIAFTSTVNAQDSDGKPAAEKSDVRVITQAVYRNNGSGYNDPERPSHIWTVAAPKVPGQRQKAKQVTNGEFAETDLIWSRDGSKIFFLSNRVHESYYQPQGNELYAMAAAGGSIQKIASIEGAMRSPSLSPDGTRIAFVGT